MLEINSQPPQPAPIPYILRRRLDGYATEGRNIGIEDQVARVEWWMRLLRGNEPEQYYTFNPKDADPYIAALAATQGRHEDQARMHLSYAVATAEYAGQRVVRPSLRVVHSRNNRTVAIGTAIGSTGAEQETVFKMVTSQSPEGFGIGLDTLYRVVRLQSGFRSRGVTLPFHTCSSGYVEDVLSRKMFTVGQQQQEFLCGGRTQADLIKEAEGPHVRRRIMTEAYTAFGRNARLLRTPSATDHEAEVLYTANHPYGQYAYPDGRPVLWGSYRSYISDVLDWYSTVAGSLDSVAPSLLIKEFYASRNAVTDHLMYWRGTNLYMGPAHGDADTPNILSDGKTFIDWDYTQDEAPFAHECAKPVKPIFRDARAMWCFINGVCSPEGFNFPREQIADLLTDTLHYILLDEIDRYVYVLLSLTEQECEMANTGVSLMDHEVAAMDKEIQCSREVIAKLRESSARFYTKSDPEERPGGLDFSIDADREEGRLGELIQRREALHADRLRYNEPFLAKKRRIAEIQQTLKDVMELIRHPGRMAQLYGIDAA